MPTNMLQLLAERYGGKLSNCKIYDSTVCTYHPDAERPWKLIVQSGEPFSRRLQFTHKERRLIVLENRDYVNGRVNGSFASGRLSINAKLGAGFRSVQASTLTLGGHHYPIYCKAPGLSSDQEDLLRRPELISLVEDSGLREGESLFFTQGDMGFYLRNSLVDRIVRAMDRLVNLARQTEIPEEKLNLDPLPAQFHPLIPLIERWAVDDDSDRNDLLETVSKSLLQALVAEVEPYFEAIDSYLDSFHQKSPPEHAAALGRLAECALEATQHLTTKNG
jgi:hypothetical protein